MYESLNPYAIITVKCAGSNCTQVRWEANHWLILWADGPGGMLHCVPFEQKMFDLVGVGARPVCGSKCAHEIFQKFLDKKEI